MVRRCVWSRNLVNEEAMTHWGAVALKTNTQTNKQTGMYLYKPENDFWSIFISDTYHPDTIYVSKYVMVRGYFLKPKELREQKVWKTPVFTDNISKIKSGKVGVMSHWGALA